MSGCGGENIAGRLVRGERPYGEREKCGGNFNGDFGRNFRKTANLGGEPFINSGADESFGESRFSGESKRRGFVLLKILILLIIAAIACVIFAVPVYNNLVAKSEEVNAAWAQVQSQYKRRVELIPGFVQIVKDHATHEKDALQGVISAQAKVTALNLDDASQNRDAFFKFNAAQSELSSALSRLMLAIERYPELRADQNFASLQNELESSRSRIAAAFKDYAAAAREYNEMIRAFPTSVVAKLVGMSEPRAALE